MHNRKSMTRRSTELSESCAQIGPANAGPEDFSERAPAAIFRLGSSFELSRFFYSGFLQMPLLVARPAKF